MTTDDILGFFDILARIIGILVLATPVLYGVGWLIVTPLEWVLGLLLG